MKWNFWFRQIHRWLSVVFSLVVAGIFTTLGLGIEPAEWVYFLPLPPLALMVVTGLYLFFLPYVANWRRSQNPGAAN